MKQVHAAQNPAEAHLVAGFLEENGIRCIVEGEMLFGARGEIGLSSSTLPQVFVADGDAARAVELLRARHAEVNTAEIESAADGAVYTDGV